MPRAAQPGDWLALLALTVLWGSAFALNEIALASFSPATLVAGRIILAAVAMFVVLRAHGLELPRFGRTWIPVIILALFGNVVPFHLIAWAQTRIDSSLTGVLMAVMPLFVLTLAHFFVPGARLTWSRSVGFVAGFIGVAAVIGPANLRGVEGNTILPGALAALAAAFSYAASTIYARRLGATDPLRLSVGMLLVASVLALPGAVFDLGALPPISTGATVAVIALGLLSTGLATLLYFRLVQGPGPTFLSFVNYLVPAWAVLAGALVLGESLAPLAYCGLLLILSGIAFSELGPKFFTRLRLALRRRSGMSPARESS